MSSVQLLINDQDYTKDLLSDYLPVRSRPIYGQPGTLDSTTIQLANLKSQYSPLSPSSIFYGIPDLMDAFRVQIIQGNREAYAGRITNVAPDSARTCTITLQSELALSLERPFEFVQSETSAGTLVEYFALLYGLTPDPISITRSNNYLSSIGFTVSSVVRTFGSPIMALFDAVSALCCGSIYADSGLVKFDVYQDLSDEDPVITFTSSQINRVTLRQLPQYERLEQETVGGYTATWAGGTFTIGDPLTQLQSINGGPGSLVTLPTLESATAAGNQWLGFLQKPQWLVRFSVGFEYLADMEPGMVVGVVDTITPGAPDLTRLEILSLTCTDPLTCVVEGLVI